MPQFQYTASMESRDRATRGTITADSQRHARDLLRDQGYRWINVSSPASSTPTTRLFRRSSRSQMATMMRELAILTGTGVPLVDSLDTLIRQHTGRIQSILRELRDDVVQGKSLAEAMSRPAHGFEELAISMVQVGEATGQLEHVLGIVADFQERSLRLQNRLLNALLYPAIVFLASIGVAIFLMTSVVPPLLESLQESGRPLPTSTVILSTLSQFLTTWGLWLCLVLVILTTITALWLRTRQGRTWKDRFLLHVPLIGRIARLQAIGRISFVMSTLLRSGLVLVRAMEIAANSCPNVILAAALRTVREALISGQDVGQALTGTSEFPPMVVQIFAVGQHSGELDAMLEKLSQDCDRQSELLSTRMATLAEPVVIVSLTVIVGFIMLATILPILEAGQDL